MLPIIEKVENTEINNFLNNQNDLEDEDFSGILLPEDCNFHTKTDNPYISTLIENWKDKSLQIPEFQRGFVWELPMACRFIESLLLDLPIPSLFFYRDKQCVDFIVDGQQRLKKIFYFVGAITENDVPKKEHKFINFRLSGLPVQSPWYNKSFKDFDDADKRRLTKRSLDTTIIILNDDNGLKGVYHIFERLNTGGSKLEAQEIRNCVFSGKFNNLLLSLNENKKWQELITLDKKQGRLKDVECILRFFALYDDLLSYKSPMKDFLSDYMRKKLTISDEELQFKRELFNTTIDAVYKYLGGHPFHIAGPINTSVCDSIMIGFAKNLNNIPNDVSKRYNKLKDNSTYRTYVGNSSNSNSNVYKRIQMVETRLFPPRSNEIDDGQLREIELFELPINGLKDFKSAKKSCFYTSNTMADFAVKINSNDMLPIIKNGDILLVQSKEKPNNGNIIIAKYQHNILCRKYISSSNCVYLRVNNTSNKQIKVPMELKKDICCIGVVIEVINGDTIK